jgi:conjugative transfer region protein TrbK
MDLKIAARMIAVLAIGSAMIVAVAALRENDTEDAPAQNLQRPGGEPANSELIRCRGLGMAAADDAACKKAWAENRRRFFGTHEPQSTTAPNLERFGPRLPPNDEPPLAPSPTKDMDRLPPGNAGEPDAEEAPTP